MTLSNEDCAEENDAMLVARCRAGRKNEYGKLVERYQGLICSLAYSATGNLGRSEELAQEAFVVAWTQLPRLREPEKFRSWLCGIARNVTNNWIRRERREPVAEAVPAQPESIGRAGEASPTEAAITREEAELLWKAVEEIPAVFREPLILYYRQDRSVKEVAALLDLTEATARQRLSRGRKVLQDHVRHFVEDALVRTSPGKALTVGVLAALPAWGGSTSAAAASAGAAMAKSTGAAQGWAISAVLGAILGPVLGVLGALFGIKASLADAESERERRFIVRWSIAMGAGITAFVLLFGVLNYAGFRFWPDHPGRLAWALSGAMIAYLVALFTAIWRFNRRHRQIRLEERGNRPPEQAEARPPVRGFHYRSSRSFLGLPLLVIHNGVQGYRPAVGWIALGNVAVGGLFAAGGVAVAPISMGGVSGGLLCLGGATFGLVGIAGLSVSVWAAGGAAIGWLSFGGVAIGWEGAMGGVAYAREFAVGGLAQANEANTDAAKALVQESGFFRFIVPFFQQGWVWVCWLPFLLVIWPCWRAWKRNTEADRQ